MNGNDIVKRVLLSPLYALMGDTMLITVTGRRTGRKLTLPVNYYRDGECLWILSDRARTWWRNLTSTSTVSLHLRGKDLPAVATVVRDEREVAARLCEYIRHIPLAARPLGVHLHNGVVDAADSARLARVRLFIRVRLSGAAA